uniref:Uncharacterized protein n=1 Tax=Arundo donax TaxID=35708 RepID=A0A0A9EGQ7_ARUDO
MCFQLLCILYTQFNGVEHFIDIETGSTLQITSYNHSKLISFQLYWSCWPDNNISFFFRTMKSTAAARQAIACL